jgi:hypothetical protein
MTGIEQIVAHVLREGLDDWVPIDTLLWYARQDSPEPIEAFKQVAISAMEILLFEGLSVIGDIGDEGFAEWPGPPVEVIGRVVAECDAVDWQPFGAVCWLSNTEKGTRRITEDLGGL